MAAFDPHQYLNSFTNFENTLHKLKGKDFNLGRVVELLDLLGRPDKDLKIIHVAGTKGKGSTCVFLSYILAAAGFRVGLYTSPHLHRINERIRVLDKQSVERREDFAGMITEEQLAQAVGALRGHVAAMINRGSFLTYFEALTAAALYFFSQQDLDWVILETGLGGRLDATNAVDAMVAVITPISLDHTHILGKTLELITIEKAGIIKSSRQRAVIAPQDEKVMALLLNRCREFGIPPIVVDTVRCQDLEISLKGEHQRVNASTAVHVVELLRHWGCKVPDEAIAEGLKRARWPGRFEVLQKKPVVIVDSAHNAASARVLAKTVADGYSGRTVTLVLGVSLDKDIQGMVRELKAMAARVILTKADHPRAHAFRRDEAGELFEGKEWSVTQTVNEALDLALSKAKDNDVIVVAGSVFVIAETRNRMLVR